MTDGDCPGDGIDWIEAWRCRQRRHRTSSTYKDGRHLWSREENARRYDASSRDEYGPRVAETIAGLPLSPTARVLDIGAGPGTLALPIARQVQEVVAVEPAEGMTTVLAGHLERDKVRNVRIVRKRWEDVDPAVDLEPPYEIVIASFSVTMEEIDEALLKMDAVAAPGGMVALYWFLDPSFYDLASGALWPGLHGSPYHGGPRADLLFLVLVQLGFLPRVEVLEFERTYRFGTMDEALDYFSPSLSIEDERGRSLLRDYLEGLARPGRDGGVVLRHPSRYARVWWQKRGTPGTGA
ncbi:MAG TPA: class I SAM-dependent methyltransferase [Methanoregulaceae archaeon]|nr:class I SAM-dependent methyltransferase [Methanoregulaceae archaeon]HQJ88804.1 class I SAM-dependent methyltransferase [Methanoregulaceae archaeon]